MKSLTKKDIENICLDYINNSIEEIAKKYNIGDRRIKKILIDNNVEIRNSHKKTISSDDYIEKNYSRFPFIDGEHYVAVLKDDQNIIFEDYLNKSGALTHYIKTALNIEIPSLFLRKKYFHENNKQWYEQWFNIVSIKNEIKKVKKCPYCNWETIDIENRSGMFLTHLTKEHGITIEKHLEKYPEDNEYFKKQFDLIVKQNKLKNKKNYVICPICNEKMEKITYWHLKSKHNMDFNEFKEKYPYSSIISSNMIRQTKEAQILGNLTVSKNRFISKYEREIQDFLKEHGIQFETNRQMLIGREIDILIEDKKIGIEFDGLKWHTEWFGKKEHRYHLEKTLKCNEKGYGLIHIFEDEYVNHKDIVISKLSHILGFDNTPSIMARKCVIKEIYKNQAENFLNENHIQGYFPSSIYLGAFYNDIIIAVMSFKNGNIKNKGWELTRFATNINYHCAGIGGKLFKYFIKNYNPYEVYSFADRRWTINIYNNFYTKIGFNIDSINPPDYKYYNEKIDKYKRIHKMTFSKANLIKKYGFPSTMTEKEMAKALGYDRIWDCGLIKYTWKKED